MRSFIYPVPTVEVGEPPDPFHEVEIDLSSGGRIIGWHHAGDPRSTRPALVFFHGNGENLETLKWSGVYDQLLSLRTAVLVVDYPGYGRSSGAPSEAGLKSSAEAALAWMKSRHPNRAIVPCGWSLGAALAVHLAAAGPVTGLITISPWTSLSAVAEIHFPRWLVGAGLREEYDSLGVAARIEAPALVIHGSVDRIIPVEQGRRLAGALAEARWMEVEQAGHNDLLGFPTVWQEIDAFVTALSPSAAL